MEKKDLGALLLLRQEKLCADRHTTRPINPAAGHCCCCGIRHTARRDVAGRKTGFTE